MSYYRFRQMTSCRAECPAQAEPLLDDDGDGQTTKNDGLFAEREYIGRRGALAGPGAALASFPEIDLTHDEETWRWSGIIPTDSFAQTGDHALVFYALYAEGKVSEPLMTAVIFDSSTWVEDWELF